MDMLDFLPKEFKEELRDDVVGSVARLAEKVPGGEKIARTVRRLSSQAAFDKAFDQAMVKGLKRSDEEYSHQDEDLVEAITIDRTFWQSPTVRQALIELVRRQGTWLVDERTIVVQYFKDILPRRVNRERVDKAVNFLLHCVLEELWTLPGVGEIREIYSLQFQKIGAEAARQQVMLLEEQLRTTTQLSTDVREALLYLARTLKQQLQITAPLPPLLLEGRLYHNLPHPDYTRFIGRYAQLDWLKQCLSSERIWQIGITGIGGVGKSALALAIAHYYREQFEELQPRERFEAIIWISAKEEALRIKGREKSSLSGLTLRTLEDIYTTIAQTLEREDITRALPEEQDYLVQKALNAQRTLLIIDNLESVVDERVRTFLYELPMSTKCIITSREWIDIAAVLKLTGLPHEEAENLINEEAVVRSVILNKKQRLQLFECTGGLPLPIKLSLARVASGEIFEQVMRWLDSATGDLPEYCVKGQIDAARQRTPDAWKLLLACALFDQTAGASREALGFIVDLSSAGRDDGLTVLQQLSLLTCTESNRFSMLPMVQGYAAAELARADFHEQLIDRWLTWSLEFTLKHAFKLDLRIDKAEIVGSEYPNLMRAIHWCRDHKRWGTLLQFVDGIWFYPYLLGLFSELREMLRAAEHASKILHKVQNEQQCIRRLSLSLWVQGKYRKALMYLEKAIFLAFEVNDELELARVCHTLTDIMSKYGHLDEAEQVAEAMLEIGERYNHLKIKALATYRLAEFAMQKKQFDKALECLHKGEVWCTEVGWIRCLAWNLYLRGAILIQQGHTTIAEHFLEQSLNKAISWNERRLIAFNKHCLAQAYMNTNRLKLAWQMAEEAHDLYERLGMIPELAEVAKLLRMLPGSTFNR